MSWIKQMIREAVIREGDTSIAIDDSHFFAILLDFSKPKRFAKFLLILFATIFSLVVLICAVVFFVNDVLFFDSRPTINAQGAIVPARSCNRETVLYLFNAADVWANTGIQVRNGDQIKVSYSGGFHSDIGNLKTSAEKNLKPRYDWITFAREKPQGGDTRFTLYDGPDADFGSVLYAVAGEQGIDPDRKYQTIHQIERKNRHVRVEQSGTLYLCVNDIYLDSAVIAHYDSINRQNYPDSGWIDEATFDARQLRAQLDTGTPTRYTDLYIVKNDTVWLHGRRFRELAGENPYAFFNDNVGEVLVTIDINRTLDWYRWQVSWYRYFENRLYEIRSGGSLAGQIVRAFLFAVWSVIVLLFRYLWPITVPVVLAIVSSLLFKKFCNGKVCHRVK